MDKLKKWKYELTNKNPITWIVSEVENVPKVEIGDVFYNADKGRLYCVKDLGEFSAQCLYSDNYYYDVTLDGATIMMHQDVLINKDKFTKIDKHPSEYPKIFMADHSFGEVEHANCRGWLLRASIKAENFLKEQAKTEEGWEWELTCDDPVTWTVTKLRDVQKGDMYYDCEEDELLHVRAVGHVYAVCGVSDGYYGDTKTTITTKTVRLNALQNTDRCKFLDEHPSHYPNIFKQDDKYSSWWALKSHRFP